MSYRRTAARLHRTRLSALMERVLWSSAAAVAASTGVPSMAPAATITVTSAADPGNAGTCTLRQAIVSTNTGAVAGTACVNSGDATFGVDDTIRFGASLFSGSTATITLADQPGNYLHAITNGTLTIDAGAGRNVTVQRPANAQNKFPILFGEALQNGNITLRLYGLTLQNGYLDDTRSDLNDALSKYSFGGFNAAGGGVGVIYGHLVMDQCTVANNTVRSMHGGAKGAGVMAGNHLTIRSSLITGNVAKGPDAMAAGVYTQLGTLSIVDSTLSGNVSQGTHGGGAAGVGVMVTPFGPITTSKLSIVNSTVSGNAAPNAQGWGAAISAPFATRVLLSNSTFACNDAPAGTAAIYVLAMPGDGRFSAFGTIFADTANSLCPTQGTSKEAVVAAGSPGAVAGDHNLLVSSGAIDAGLPFPADTILGDPLLQPLQYIGGRTPTHAIASNSPARNAGSNPTGLAYDQRGPDYPRSVGGAPDIGAFELQQAGLCGSAHGGSFATLSGSSPNLCSSGAVLQGFFGTGPWGWLCAPPSDPVNNEFCGATVLANVTMAINGPDDQTLTHDPVYGEALHLHARVAGPAGIAPPEGQVTFFDATDGGFAPLCADRVLDTGGGTWVDGWTWCVPDPDWIAGAEHVQAGQRQLKATYRGDGRFGQALSGSYPVHVLPAHSVTAIASQTPDPVGIGEPFTVVADVSLAAPSEAEAYGLVEVHDLTDDRSCVYSLDAASPGCPLTPVSAGAHELLVSFQGGANILPSSVGATQAVDPAATATSLELSPASITLGGTVTATIGVTTSVPPQIAVPGGTVTVADGADASCTIALPATTCALTPTRAGARAITASYAGDGNFLGSSGSAGLTVDVAPTTAAVSLSAATIELGETVTVTASIASDVPAAIAMPGGTITVDDGGSGAGDTCTITLPATSCVLAPAAAGPKTVTASFPGDGNFAGSSGSAALVVLEPPSQLALTIDDGQDHARYGEALAYTIVLANSGNGPATDVAVSGVPGAAFGAATLAWTCTSTGGATCAAGGSGATLADTVTLPPGSSLTWIVNTMVPQDAEGDAAVFGVGALDANASDSDVLVLFRDGFEP